MTWRWRRAITFAVKTIRHWLKDRLIAGGGMLLLAYLLMFQSLLVGGTLGAMAANAVDPLRVICVTDGLAAAPGDTDADHGTAQDCPCATLCQTAASGGIAITGHAPVVAYLAPFALSHPAKPADLPILPVRRGRAAEARAPPFLA